MWNGRLCLRWARCVPRHERWHGMTVPSWAAACAAGWAAGARVLGSPRSPAVAAPGCVDRHGRGTSFWGGNGHGRSSMVNGDFARLACCGRVPYAG